ncbi:MAG: glycosyltransferase family 2 protein [Pseudanabaenaceae cyanobacterium]
MATFTVIIPTYRRPEDLARCFSALSLQQRPPDVVRVVVRDTDTLTWDFLDEYAANCQVTREEMLPLATTTVYEPGVIAAMNAAMAQTDTDFFAFTDDDAAPHPDWIARIEAYFLADSQIVGVGGRDWVYVNGELEDGAASVVGQVQWFGRMIGNHHIGVGEMREVDLLKGVNMAYRRSAVGDLRLDTNLWGTGAQVHFEVAFCLGLKQKGKLEGWKLIYDPAIAVDHYPAKRFDEDQRQSSDYVFNETAYLNLVHNETYVLLRHLPPLRRFVFLCWAVLIGTRSTFGLLQWLRFCRRDGSLAHRKLLVAWHGRWAALQTWWQAQ